MLAKNFELWDIFENTNGYPSIVYRVTASRLFIMNYNGNFYNLSRNSSCDYNFIGRGTYDVRNFFQEFPMKALKNSFDKVRFWEIHDAYRHQYACFDVSAIQARISQLLLLLLN